MLKKLGIMASSLAILIGWYYVSVQSYLKLFDKLAGYDWFQPVLDINFRVFILAHDLTSLLIYFIIFRYVFRKNIFQMSDMRPMKRQTTLIIIALSIIMGIVMMSFVRIPAVADAFPQFNEAFDFLLGKSIWFFVVFWMVHSFYKEIFFRGLIFNSMQRVFPTWLSIFLLGIIYGALFFNLEIALSAYGMVGAVLLCLIYMWQKSIWSTIVSEFVLFSTYFAYYLIDPEFGPGIVIALVVSFPIGLYLLYLLWKTRIGGEESVKPVSSVEVAS